MINKYVDCSLVKGNVIKAVVWACFLLSAADAAAAQKPKPVDMKLLLLAVDGKEPSFTAIQGFLDQIGIPYDTVFAKTQPLPRLNDATKGFYQGIILTTGNLGFCEMQDCQSALPAQSWAALDQYAADFAVRTLSYYTYPEARYGLAFVEAVPTTQASPGTASFLPAAAQLFPDLNQSNAIPIVDAYTYLAIPLQETGETTTPVLSMYGLTVGAIHTKADGREYLALTMDNNPSLLHSMALHYGLLNWVTKGIFLGFRKIYLSPHIDDLFSVTGLFDSRVPACIPIDPVFGSISERSDKCPPFRIAAEDLDVLRVWQDTVTENVQTRDFKVTFSSFEASSGTQNKAGGYLANSVASIGGESVIPYRATNMFYNASTPVSGVAGSLTDEYNYFYGPDGLFRLGGTDGLPFFDTPQSYAQIIGRESNNYLSGMLTSDTRPIVFHQANLARYDGTRTLFKDALGETLSKFTRVCTLPVTTLPVNAIGQLMEQRKLYEASGVKATLTPGVSITLTTARGATIPITGACVSGCESYGTQRISYVSVSPGAPVTLTLN